MTDKAFINKIESMLPDIVPALRARIALIARELHSDIERAEDDFEAPKNLLCMALMGMDWLYAPMGEKAGKRNRRARKKICIDNVLAHPRSINRKIKPADLDY